MSRVRAIVDIIFQNEGEPAWWASTLAQAGDDAGAGDNALGNVLDADDDFDGFGDQDEELGYFWPSEKAEYINEKSEKLEKKHKAPDIVRVLGEFSYICIAASAP